MAVIKVNLDNFAEEVLRAEKPVLLDMYADWCGPCNMMAPEIEAFAEENEEIKVCKLNVDEATDLALTFGVMSIPTLIGLKGGEIANKAIGSKNEAQILQLLNV